MATHSSVLAWRIPGTGEPGGAVVLWKAGKLPGGKLTVKNPGGDLTVTVQAEGETITSLLLEGPTAIENILEI